MLEVVENKGANLRFERRFDALDRGGRVIRARVGSDKHNLVYHIFTACQIISCKYKYFESIAGSGLQGIGIWGRKNEKV
jgi:hypothetical protein